MNYRGSIAVIPAFSGISGALRCRRGCGALPCSARGFPSPVRRASGQCVRAARTGPCEPSIWRRKSVCKQNWWLYAYKNRRTRQKEHIAAYLFILPSFLGIAVFYIVPYIICFVKSLYVGNTFVGIQNYIQLFQNNTFLLALKNTSIFTVVAIPLLMVISFLIALFLNSFKKISSFFRSALLIPVVVPVHWFLQYIFWWLIIIHQK